MPRLLDGKAKALRKLLTSLTFRDELRDVLSCYDLELIYDDAERDEPREYVIMEPGTSPEQPTTYLIRFRPFGWEPKREPQLRSER